MFAAVGLAGRRYQSISARLAGFWDTVASTVKQSAPHVWQVTTPTPHHSIFYRPDALLTPYQQCKSTEGTITLLKVAWNPILWVEVHRLSADDLYRPIISQFADNRYWPFDNWHRPIIGRLFVLVSKTRKMLLAAVHVDDNEITNDSVISHVSSSTFNRTK